MESFLIAVVLLGAIGFGIYRAVTAPAPEPNPHVVCPHCQHKGTVVCTQVVRKKGISGGKATGALMTGGASMLATGLSRKEGAVHMHCLNCNVQWDV